MLPSPGVLPRLTSHHGYILQVLFIRFNPDLLLGRPYSRPFDFHQGRQRVERQPTAFLPPLRSFAFAQDSLPQVYPPTEGLPAYGGSQA